MDFRDLENILFQLFWKAVPQIITLEISHLDGYPHKILLSDSILIDCLLLERYIINLSFPSG